MAGRNSSPIAGYRYAVGEFLDRRFRPRSPSWIESVPLRVGDFGILAFVGHDAAPDTRRSPDSATDDFELDDLAVIHEEVDVGTVVLHVPREHVGVGRLEHDLLRSEGADDLRDDVRAPRLHALRDAFRFDHDQVRPCLEELLRGRDGPAGIAHALCLEFLRARRPARAPLDADFRLRFQTLFLRAIHEGDPVVDRNAD